jgi:hypothetical protein
MRTNKLVAGWKKQYARATKYYLKGRKASKTRNIIGGLTIVLILMGVVGYAMMAPPAKDTPTPQAQRVAENRKARLELESPRAADAVATAGRAQAQPPVTVTGCLETHHDGYRLKDASGGDIHGGRSWKSGFLKKGSPSVDLVDGSNKLKLHDHVGQRVSVTGTLEDKEMQARSMKTVASDCNTFTK